MIPEPIQHWWSYLQDMSVHAVKTPCPVIQVSHRIFPSLPRFNCHRVRLSGVVINHPFRNRDPEHATKFWTITSLSTGKDVGGASVMRTKCLRASHRTRLSMDNRTQRRPPTRLNIMTETFWIVNVRAESVRCSRFDWFFDWCIEHSSTCRGSDRGYLWARTHQPFPAAMAAPTFKRTAI